MKYFSISLVFIFLMMTSAQADQSDRRELVKNSAFVMDEIMDSPDGGIPQSLISKAKAIIIFPTMLKGGFLVAARYGQGVATVRSEKTGSWGPPAFLTTVGGSFGFQIGAQAVDLVLLVMTERGLNGLLKDKFTLGADVGIAAGPVGRYAEAGADVLMQGEIYSYSRSKGVFAGVSLKGTVIMANNDANNEYYRQDLTSKEILISHRIKRVPKSTRRFIEDMNKLAPFVYPIDPIAKN
jgi:lipid-binding SYLF domain-containing protein